MSRHHIPLWIGTALLLLAGCAGGGSGGEAAPSAVPQAGAPTLAVPTPTAAPQPGAPTTAAQPRPSTVAQPAPAGDSDAAIALREVTSDVSRPLFVTHAGDDSGRLFVIEKGGTIAIVSDGRRAPVPFLDITTLVDSGASERGLLGLAFHPAYEENGRFFVYYTAKNGDNTVARYQVSGEPDAADPASGVVLLAVPDPAPNHNGGMLAFGPDGYLYVGLGDGGSGGDPWGNGQNRDALLGKLLRLDVDTGDPYGIPPDNPWPDGGEGRPEVWAYGLRNPWRFSFDRATGDLFIADVGQNAYEEINFQPSGGAAGLNYGWNLREAAHCFRGQACETAGLVDPIAEYAHDEGCSVTGGYVYRGAAFPSLQGSYIFGDYCSGTIWSLRQDAPGQWERREILDSGMRISSFGEDEDGELYLTNLGGGLYQVIGV
jgi:glucose/arabinose dehydrogenase